MTLDEAKQKVIEKITLFCEYERKRIHDRNSGLENTYLRWLSTAMSNIINNKNNKAELLEAMTKKGGISCFIPDKDIVKTKRLNEGMESLYKEIYDLAKQINDNFLGYEPIDVPEPTFSLR